MKARERVNILLMNKLDTERSAEPKETLIVLEWVSNATWEYIAIESVLEYSINFPAVCQCVWCHCLFQWCFMHFFLSFSILKLPKLQTC